MRVGAHENLLNCTFRCLCECREANVRGLVNTQYVEWEILPPVKRDYLLIGTDIWLPGCPHNAVTAVYYYFSLSPRDDQSRVPNKAHKLKSKAKAKKLRRKILQKEKKPCNLPGMSCFNHDNDHWKTPPYWTRKSSFYLFYIVYFFFVIESVILHILFILDLLRSSLCSWFPFLYCYTCTFISRTSPQIVFCQSFKSHNTDNNEESNYSRLC